MSYDKITTYIFFPLIMKHMPSNDSTQCTLILVDCCVVWVLSFECVCTEFWNFLLLF
jgi:hypothetical protein